ncbi:2-C-methyl-D-erythritol 4-phosphate cytidylyltransferase [Natronohydrobacter thiooxidans]|uniref:2-C-methyl-D-erythritol 4-phosphate cytidylyltransferase n=1 Tax=Natronohydrobacter thiooxidans TaxID=87172 RepID=UPI0008FF3C48|nr:2-C-methyl-D-erythritol 4-phosphate cytidylyltransferase [Natronohydrobacter thiooxidans]
MAQTLAAIIVAAGRGTRAGPGGPKQWRPLAGRPVLAWTLDAFRKAGLTRLVLAIHPEDRDQAEALLRPGEIAVTGGADRAASVRAALESLSDSPPDLVLIHDGARPLVSAAVIAGVITALQTSEGAAPALPVIDALWRGQNGLVQDTAPRDGLYRAQTPQGFHFAAILQAHRAHSGPAADDVEIARAAGMRVAITPGCEDNFKLTYAPDFARAARLLGA